MSLVRADTPDMSMEVVCCLICMEPLALQDCISFQNCTAKHCLCKQCAKQSLQSQIAEASESIVCVKVFCTATVTHSELATIVEPDLLHKHIRFTAMSKDKSYRECSACNRRLIFAGKKSMYCTCGVKSCFEHGTAHLKSSCLWYSFQCIPSNLTIWATTRKCPGCGVRIEKNGGCRHMHCSRCGNDHYRFF